MSTEEKTVQEIKSQIEEFETRFNALAQSTREQLESRKIRVQRVVESLTQLPADDKPEHKVFLEEKMSSLTKVDGIFNLFFIMNLYWNYLSYQLLDYLIKKFFLNEVRLQMNQYKQDLQHFLARTPAKLFCQVQTIRKRDPPEGFEEMITEFAWSENTTLLKVEEFRKKYICHYNLHDCAMLLSFIFLGSFGVVWLIPHSVVERLKKETDEIFLAKCAVSSLHIAGTSIYSKLEQAKVTLLIIKSRKFSV